MSPIRELWARVRDGFLPQHLRYTILVLEPDHGAPRIPAGLEETLARLGIAYTFEWLDLESEHVLDDYVEYRRRPTMTRQEVEKRLSDGRLCYLARREGRIVGDTWIALRDYPLPARNERLETELADAGFAYSYMSYVSPRARGQGVFALLIAATHEAVHEKGGTALFGCVLDRSRSSRQTVKRLGFTSRGQLHVVDLRGRRMSWFRPDRAPAVRGVVPDGESTPSTEGTSTPQGVGEA